MRMNHEGVGDGLEYGLCSLAGSAVQHLTREMTDPRSIAALAGATGKASAPALDPETMVDGTVPAQPVDEPIPVLGGKTSRQALGFRAERDFPMRLVVEAPAEAHV